MSRSYAERRGAHRPAGLGPTSAIPWAIAAVAIVLIVGFATGWFGGSGEPTSSTVAVSSAPGSKPAATTKAAGSSPASGSASSSTSSQAADRTVAVTVLNGTRRAGLAAGAAAKLKAAGWSIRATGNHQGGGAPTTVYYGDASLQATAQAVAKDLGGSATVQQSADFGPRRVTVVLGTDFQP